MSNILKDGLKVGSKNASSNLDKNSIYLTSDWQEIVQDAEFGFADRNLSLFKVDISDIKSDLRVDTEYDSYEGDRVWFTKKDISPEKLTYMGDITVKRLGTSVQAKLTRVVSPEP